MLASSASSSRVAPGAMMRSSVMRLCSHGGGDPGRCQPLWERLQPRAPGRDCRRIEKLAAEAAPTGYRSHRVSVLQDIAPAPPARSGQAGIDEGAGRQREGVLARVVVEDV